jgi:hypothetical protein
MLIYRILDDDNIVFIERKVPLSKTFSHVGDKAAFFGEIARMAFAGAQPRRWELRHLLEPICRKARLGGLADIRELRKFAEAAGYCALQPRI